MAQSDGHTLSVTILLPRKFPTRGTGTTEVAETRCGGELQLLPPELAIIAPIPPAVECSIGSSLRQLEARSPASNKDGGSPF